MPSIQHADITNAHNHEPKGVAAANADQVYISDGAGSGAWTDVAQFSIFSAFPIGAVIAYAGSTPPVGWSFCYGQLVGRVQYSNLFAAIGVSFGVGDGATTFQLPDCRGRVLAGKDNMGGSAAGLITTAGSGIDGSTLAAAGGSQNATLGVNNIPAMSGTTNSTGAHTHSLLNGTSTVAPGSTAVRLSTGATVGSAVITTSSNGAHTHSYTVNAGSSNAAHNNVQPTFIMPMIIYHGVA